MRNYKNPILYIVFFLSGFSALIYQLAWQRRLFTIMGSDSTSITIVVSLFMFGLGFGSLLGGELATRYLNRRILIFSLLELLIGVFGITSVFLLAYVEQNILSMGYVGQTTVCALLLLIPTLLMGATLPIITSYVSDILNDLSRSISFLYFINTLGAALASYVTVKYLFAACGLSGVIYVAALINIVNGLAVYMVGRRDAIAD